MNFEAVQLTRAARGIGGMARALLFDLAIYANDAGEAQVSAQRLAEDLGTDVRWIRRILSDMVGCGLLAVAEKGNGRGRITAYRFVKNSGDKTMVSDPDETVVHRRKNSGQKRAESMVCTPPSSKEVKEARDSARARARDDPNANQDGGKAALRWQDAMARLRMAIDSESFEAWLSGVECLMLDRAQIVLAAPSDFIRRWIVRNYADQVISAARDVLGGDDEPVLIVNVQESDWS